MGKSTQVSQLDSIDMPWAASQRAFDFEGISTKGYGYTVVITGGIGVEPENEEARFTRIRNLFTRSKRKDVDEMRGSDPAARTESGEDEKGGRMNVNATKSVEVRESFAWNEDLPFDGMDYRNANHLGRARIEESHN